ncbi:MAG: hypothetical protein EBX03_11475 [Rhodobacteraceae bacterium]|nr:hypothetical protein [Paracoccaceae bacterium]NCX92182.1 hypothetical protein [Paracoccaceae bacterium]
MKLLFTTLLAALSCFAYAEDNWQTMENNYKFEGDTYGVELRTYADDDYDHVEFTSKLSSNLKAAVRIAEDGETTEYRPKLTHKVLKKGPFSFAHRLEYRYFEGPKDDNARYRWIAKLNAGGLWLTAQPRWEFGHGKTGDAKVDSVKWQTGFDLPLATNVTLTPFAEYLTAGEDGKWQKEHLIGGTTLKVKF